MLSLRIRKSLSVKGKVAEATYFLPFLPKEGEVEVPAYVLDAFRAQLRSKGLKMYGKPVVEIQQEMFEPGDNIRVSSFVEKL